MQTEGLHSRLIDSALPVGCKPAPLTALQLMYFPHGGTQKKKSTWKASKAFFTFVLSAARSLHLKTAQKSKETHYDTALERKWGLKLITRLIGWRQWAWPSILQRCPRAELQQQQQVLQKHHQDRNILIGGKCLKQNNSFFFPENDGMECQRRFLEKKTSTTRLRKAFSFPVHLSALLHFSQRETYHTCARVDVKIDMSEQIIYNILSIISQVSNLCEIFIVLC